MRPLLPLLLLLSVATLLSCRRGGGGVDVAVDEDSAAVMADSSDIAVSDLTDMAYAKADSLLATMTLRQRVGQCFMPTIYTRSDEETLNRLEHYISRLHVGGVVLLKGDLRSAVRMSVMASEATVPLFTAIDAEWGLGMRLKDAPDFPRNGRLSPAADEQLLYDYGREVARECRRVGINMVLGPVIDVVENPRGVIGSRSFGSDPVRVADLGVAYALGIESGGVISVAKHFPGHGSPLGDSHKSLQVIGRSLHQLDSVDLYPFRRYIDSGLTGVMVGHLAVPAIDPQSRPAAVSDVVIQDLLREELDFRGLVLTDALNMAGAEGSSAAEAIKAGADIIIGPADTEWEINQILKAVEQGSLDSVMIADRCRRILFHKALIGLSPVSAPPLKELREDMAEEARPIRQRLEYGNR